MDTKLPDQNAPAVPPPSNGTSDTPPPATTVQPTNQAAPPPGATPPSTSPAPSQTTSASTASPIEAVSTQTPQQTVPSVINPTPPFTTVADKQTPPPAGKKNLRPILLVVVGILLLVTTVYAIYLFLVTRPQPAAKTTQPAAAVQQPTPTVDPMANWNTYTNTTYGFSLQYPSVFVACDPTNQKSFLLRKAPFTCPKGSNDVGYDFGVFAMKASEYKPYKKPTEVTRIMIDGVSATQNSYTYTDADGPLAFYKGSTEIIIARNSMVIQITLLSTDQDLQKYFQNIVATFKFTVGATPSTGVGTTTSQRQATGTASPTTPTSTPSGTTR